MLGLLSFITRRNAAAAMAIIVTAVMLIGPGRAQAVDRIGVAYGPNNAVTTISEPDANGTRYLSGQFTAFNPWDTGRGALTDGESGAVDRTFTAVDDGAILDAAPDGFGGFFIGGTFTSVGGTARNHAAHINADGSLDATWDPSPNDSVEAVTVAGSIVYLGGDFTLVGGETRNHAAAVGTDGALAEWNPNVGGSNCCGTKVHTIVVSGSTVYLGGDFTTVGVYARTSVAAVGANGTPTNWTPQLGHDTPYFGSIDVQDIAIAGSTVYVVGSFTIVDGLVRNHAAAIGTDGTLEPWDPNLGGSAYAITVSGSTIYLGGPFTTVNGTARSHVAAVTAQGTGVLTGWDPQLHWATYEPEVQVVETSGSTVYVGGTFSDVDGTTRNGAAAIGTDGVLKSWNPNPNCQVSAIAFSGSKVFIGGCMTSAGGIQRRYVAAVDADGTLTPWDPDVNGQVRAIAVAGSTVYLGGDFTRVGGTTRNHAAAINADGTLGSWNPNTDLSVDALAVAGSTVYVGGEFCHVGAVAQCFVAAIEADGTLDSWNPNPAGFVMSLVVSGSTVYLGGSFHSLGQYSRQGVGAVDIDGTVTNWDPQATIPNCCVGSVTAMVVSGATVYLAGGFTHINGQLRSHVAAVDTDGHLLPWDPNPDAQVNALAVDGGTIYIGGFFHHVGINSTPRSGAAAVDADGALLPWNPRVDIGVGAIATSGSAILLGGWFTHVGGTTRYSAAAVDSAGNLLSPLWNWGQTSDIATPPTDPSPAPESGSTTSSPESPKATESSSSMARDPAPLMMQRPSCTSALCSTAGSVPEGATQVVQIATRSPVPTAAASSRTIPKGRAVTRCKISSTEGKRTFSCKQHLAPGTWLLTTLAKAGPTVIAESIRRIRVPVPRA